MMKKIFGKLFKAKANESAKSVNNFFPIRLLHDMNRRKSFDNPAELKEIILKANLNALDDTNEEHRKIAVLVLVKISKFFKDDAITSSCILIALADSMRDSSMEVNIAAFQAVDEMSEYYKNTPKMQAAFAKLRNSIESFKTKMNGMLADKDFMAFLTNLSFFVDIWDDVTKEDVFQGFIELVRVFQYCPELQIRFLFVILKLKQITNQLTMMVNSAEGVVFIRPDVVSTQTSSYAAFGVTRDAAYKLLISKLGEIKDILQPAVEKQLLDEVFVKWLSETNMASGDILKAFIDYHFRARQMNAGQTHPCVLQALAFLRETRLRLWECNDQNELIPSALFHDFNQQQEEVIDLLFVNNNYVHLKVLDDFSDDLGELVKENPINFNDLNAEDYLNNFFANLPNNNKLRNEILSILLTEKYFLILCFSLTESELMALVRFIEAKLINDINWQNFVENYDSWTSTYRADYLRGIIGNAIIFYGKVKPSVKQKKLQQLSTSLQQEEAAAAASSSSGSSQLPSADNFVDALRKLLIEAKDFNVVGLLRDTNDRSEQTSVLVKTFRYFVPQPANDIANRGINSLVANSPSLFWSLLRKVNFTRASYVVAANFLSFTGFTTKEEWMLALESDGGDLKSIIVASNILSSYLASYKSNYANLLLDLIKNNKFVALIQDYQGDLAELCAAAQIPGLDLPAAQDLWVAFIELHKEIIQLPNYQQLSFMGLSFALSKKWAGESKPAHDILNKVLQLMQKLEQVIGVFTDQNFEYHLQTEINKLLAKIPDLIALGISNCSYYSVTHRRINLGKLCLDYEGRLGVMDTPIANAVHSKQFKQLRFTGSDDNPYCFEQCLLEDFDFTDTTFVHCSFAHSVLKNCIFENVVITESINLDGAEIDRDTAKHLLPALRRAKANGVQIIGKKILEALREESDAVAVSAIVSLAVSSSASASSQSSLSTSSSATGSSYLQSLYSNVASYTTGVMTSSLQRGISILSGEIGEDELLEDFEEDEAIDDGHIQQLKDNLEQRIRELDSQLERTIGLEGANRIELEKLKQAFVPIQKHWQHKQAINDDRQKLLRNPTLAIFYKSLHVQLCATFHALLILRTKLIAMNSGELTSVAAKANAAASGIGIANTTISVVSGASIAAQYTPTALTTLNTLFSGVSMIDDCMNFIKPVLGIIPVVGGVANLLGSITQCVVDASDRYKLETGHTALDGLTPKGLEKLAEEIARTLSFMYEEQILLLTETEKGAKRFAEGGAMRIFVLILTGHIKGDQPVEEIAWAISQFKINQSEVELPLLKKSIELPGFMYEEKLETVSPDDAGITQDMLYRLPGRWVEYEGARIYFSNDAKNPINPMPNTIMRLFRGKFERPYPRGLATDAKRVGYIKYRPVPSASEMPTGMTPDISRLGPRSKVRRIAINLTSTAAVTSVSTTVTNNQNEVSPGANHLQSQSLSSNTAEQTISEERITNLERTVSTLAEEMRRLTSPNTNRSQLLSAGPTHTLQRAYEKLTDEVRVLRNELASLRQQPAVVTNQARESSSLRGNSAPSNAGRTTQSAAATSTSTSSSFSTSAALFHTPTSSPVRSAATSLSSSSTSTTSPQNSDSRIKVPALKRSNDDDDGSS